MQISGLPVSTAFGAADVLAIEINGITYKITGATIAAALQSMGDYVTAQDIANNLTTTDAGYVLDARQGKALLDALEAIGASDVGAVAVDQGAANAGKALVVGNDGNVTTGDAGIPEAVKVSLLDLVRHVAYIDDQGQAYYDALYAALYGGSGGYPRLQAVYAPGTHVVYTDDALDTLREYLTVKRYESAQDSGTVVTDYTLSGTLADGMSTVLVRADGLVTAVQVEAVDFYNQYRWSLSGGTLAVTKGGTTVDSTTSTSAGTACISNGPTQILLRRAVAARRGVIPYVYEAASPKAEEELYPIPIPANAGKCTITMTPSQQHYINITKFDGEKYNKVSQRGWQDSGLSYTFNADSDQFLVLALRVDSSNTQYSAATEPTEIVIVFEEA